MKKPIVKKTRKPVKKEAVTLTRLKNLLRVMEFVAKKPKTAYDITTIHEKFEDAQDFQDTTGIDRRKYPPCGTIACTAGWAGLDPWFRRRGFKTEDDSWCTFGGLSIFAWGLDSTAAWFGITHQEANTLFIDGVYGSYEQTTAKQVVKYLKKLVKQYEVV